MTKVFLKWGIVTMIMCLVSAVIALLLDFTKYDKSYYEFAVYINLFGIFVYTFSYGYIRFKEWIVELKLIQTDYLREIDKDTTIK